jgi:hypothetical protein
MMAFSVGMMAMIYLSLAHPLSDRTLLDTYITLSLDCHCASSSPLPPSLPPSREFKTKNDEMTKRLSEFTKSNADSLQEQKALTQVHSPA